MVEIIMFFPLYGTRYVFKQHGLSFFYNLLISFSCIFSTKWPLSWSFPNPASQQWCNIVCLCVNCSFQQPQASGSHAASPSAPALAGGEDKVPLLLFSHCSVLLYMWIPCYGPSSQLYHFCLLLCDSTLKKTETDHVN